MKAKSLFLCFFFSFQLVTSVYAQGSSKAVALQKAMIQDLDVAKYNLSIKYAPKEWKQEYLGWNLEKAYEIAKNRILNENPTTAKEYQNIFRDFLLSTKDYHVKPYTYSTASSFFPLKVKSADGHYVITSFGCDIVFVNEENLFELEEVNDDLLVSAFSKVRIGDELLSMNGVPIKEVIEQMIDNELGGDRTSTGYALAERMLFYKRGKYCQSTPSGTFEITLQHKDDKSIETLAAPWIHTPEWVKDYAPIQQFEMSLKSVKPSVKTIKSNQSLDELLSKNFMVSYAEDLVDENFSRISKKLDAYEKSYEENEKDEDDEEREKGFLPKLGKVLWQTPTEKNIYAYLYENNSGKRIGYIYLHSFMPGRMEEAAKEISEILQFFNENAEALVFDITNNPGGELLFMYGVLSLLTDHPLTPPTNREILIPQDVYKAAVIYNVFHAMSGMDKNIKDLELDNTVLQETSKDDVPSVNGYSVNEMLIQQVKDYAQMVMHSWQSGRSYTPTHYLWGIDQITPHPRVQFTKPLLILINELDFSCADIFPAILQDNQRAILFGKKTAGAGGCVGNFSHTSKFGIQGYTLTGSIAYRVDGTPIENLGVKPDVPYELTLRDLQENYVDYIRAVNTTVEKMLN